MTKEKKIDFVNFIVPGLFIISWIVIPKILDTPEYLLPSLSRVWNCFVDFVTGNRGLTAYSGKFFENAVASLYRVVCGFGIASVLGIILEFYQGIF